MRLKDVAHLNRHVLAEGTDPDFSFWYIDIGSIDGQGRIYLPDKLMRLEDAPSRARRIAPPGSTVVSTVRTYLRAIACVPRFEEQLVFSTGFAVLESKEGVHPRFLSYLCRSDDFIAEIVARSVGVSYPAINPGELGRIPVRLPSLVMQRHIADFLDAETARIDRLINNSHEQSRLLQERFLEFMRLSTTGVGGPRRETGVEWMPSIQADWALRKVAREFKTSSGTTPDAQDARFFDGPYPWVNSSDLQDADIERVDRSVTQDALNTYSALRIQPAGSLIIAMYGQGETKGRTGLLRIEACLNQACCALIRTGTISIEFAQYWFRAHRKGVISLAYGAGQPNLSQELIRQLVVPDPGLARQEQIVRDLRTREGDLRRQLGRLAARRALLSERRRALITTTVTGQIDAATASEDTV